MSARSKARAKNRRRIRKVACVVCDYTAWTSRANLARGLPRCPCGAEMWPVHPGDRVDLGLMELDDLPRRTRTQLCREMGWEDEIVRTSPSQAPGGRSRIRIRPRTLEKLPF